MPSTEKSSYISYISLAWTSLHSSIEKLGYYSFQAISGLGYSLYLFYESCVSLILGAKKKQAVRLSSIFSQAVNIGFNAIPIIAILCFAIGAMLAIQGIAQLKPLGFELQVVVGVAHSVTREFAPLIVAILVAGRTGSSIAAKIGSMLESQEIDALRVMGINPIRYLVAPILVAMFIMLPCLTVLGDFMAIVGSAIYTNIDLNLPLSIYAEMTFDTLSVEAVQQGIVKSFVFAIIIALVGVANGFKVSGGAEGVGKATTRSVVQSISIIIIADMVFTYFLNR